MDGVGRVSVRLGWVVVKDPTGEPYAVAAAGGTAYGAFYVPVAEAIQKRHGRLPEVIDCVSTACLTGSLWASDMLDVHRAEYERLRGTDGFARLQWWAPWRGLLNLRPRLGKRLEVHRVGEKLKRPVRVNTIHVASRKSCQWWLNDMAPTDARDAIIAGCTWTPPIMTRAMVCGEAHMDSGAGGAFLHSFTAQELRSWQVRTLYLLVPTPVGEARRDFPGAGDLGPFEEVEATYQRIMADRLDRDLEWAHDQAAAAGVRVVVIAPASWDGLGTPFQATPEVIRARFAAGEAAVRGVFSTPGAAL